MSTAEVAFVPGCKIVTYETTLSFLLLGVKSEPNTQWQWRFKLKKKRNSMDQQEPLCAKRLPDVLVNPQDALSAISESSNRRKGILSVARELGLENNPRFRSLLLEDDNKLVSQAVAIAHSKEWEAAVLRLRNEAAQQLLDHMQSLLDRRQIVRGPSPRQDQSLRRLIRKLSESSDRLPASLFVQGITERGDHPVYGGGFGDIYRANFNDKPVAVKLLRHFLHGTEAGKMQQKLLREALVWKELHHPNILPFIGVDREMFPPAHCLVSPWMENGNILTFLQRSGHKQIIQFLEQIADGLKYLHSLNIVHGDLRGANILVDHTYTACLADFGLSAVSEVSASTSTRAGNVRWMAPELIDPDLFGTRFRRTPQTDVYAFACVCIELYTGRPPFSDYTEGAALLKVLDGKRPPMPTSTPLMPHVLWQHVQRYWTQIADARPSAASIVDDLASLLKHEKHAASVLAWHKELRQSGESAALEDLPDEVLEALVVNTRIRTREPLSPLRFSEANALAK